MKNFLLVLGAILGALLIAFLGSFLIAIPVLYLWNWIMPEIFGLIVITYWQAWGITLLSGLLLKSHSTSSSNN